MSTLVSFTKSANDEATEGAVYAMPATPLQVRLWKLNEAAPDPAWNVAVRFRLSGSLDREKFEQALQWLVIRHEALRTSFTVRDGEVSERILAKASLPLQWCDLETLDPAAQEAEVARLSLEHARQILPLTSAPLLRAGMLRLADTEHILVWNAHHSVCDGWSVGLLVSDLMACYGDVLQGKEPVAPTALDFGDYAVWLDAQRKTPEYESHRVYWKQQLQDLEVAPLPDAWHAAATAKESTIQSMLLPRSLTDAIATVAQRHHSTFFHAVLAAFGLLLRTQQLQADVALETPIGGRDQSELENVVGAFVNYLPLRFRVDEEMRFSDLLHAVRDMVTDCFDHAQFRCEDMLADLEKEGNPAAKGKTLTQVAFICQQDFVRPITTGGVAMTAVPSVSPGALRPLTVFMVERADGWRLSCEVDNHLVSQDAGLRLLEDFQRLLGVVVGAAEESTVEVAARAGLAPIATQADQNIATRFQGALQLQDGVVRMPATEFQRRFCRLGLFESWRDCVPCPGPFAVDGTAGCGSVGAGDCLRGPPQRDFADNVKRRGRRGVAGGSSRVAHRFSHAGFGGAGAGCRALGSAAPCGPRNYRPGRRRRIFSGERTPVPGACAAAGKRSPLAGNHDVPRDCGWLGHGESFWNSYSRRTRRKLVLAPRARLPFCSSLCMQTANGNC